MAKKRADHWIKRHPWLSLIILSVAIFLIPAVFKYTKGIFGFGIVYSQGDRIGQVVKLSEKGLIWKTWEAGMGITQSGAYVGYWEFSVDRQNPDQAKIVQDLSTAMQTGALVKITYQQRYGALPWHGETEYFAERVEFPPDQSSAEQNSS